MGKATLTRTATAARLALAFAAMFAVSPAQSQGFVVKGGCRDGQPNGLYELRMPDERLRVVGAFARGRRTGTFIFWDAKGARIAVVPYDEDVKVGTVAVWYDPALAKVDPPRKSETAYADGVLHGVKRSWHPNGSPRSELRYEQGALVEARAWTAGGAALSSSRAKRQAEQDAVADERFYADLEKTIADHLPHCEQAAAGKEKP